MKIICVGRNYADHAKELKNDVPTEPVLFLKPDTALLQRKAPFFIPEFSQEIHHELELVIRINKIGKHIAPQFAHKYYEEIGVGIDFTARDLQQKLKSAGLPWEKAKAFDGSAPLGDFVPKSTFSDLNNINFHLLKNGQQVQVGNTKDMLFQFDQLIAYISSYFTLKIGDLIFTGTPAGVGPVAINDHLEAFVENQKLLDLKIK